MPRDKTQSHNRIRNVARAEFLEKGYEKASMREIGRKAGMTQAALYRHFESKEAMFDDLVKPFVSELLETAEKHEQDAYANFDMTSNADSMVTDNVVIMMKRFLIEYHDELRLIICCSHGTRYENFIHDLVTDESRRTLAAFDYMRSRGCNIKEISEDELHVILSAYMAAILEPIEHNWPMDKAISCLNLVEEFFMPAWAHIMGF